MITQKNANVNRFSEQFLYIFIEFSTSFFVYLESKKSLCALDELKVFSNCATRRL